MYEKHGNCIDLHMNLYWNWYRNGSGAAEPFLYRFTYDFVLKLVQKSTWSCKAIFVQIYIWICIEIGTEMDLELQSHFCIDVHMNLYWNWYRNGPGAPEQFWYGFAYEFVLKLIQKWTWSTITRLGQIGVWIRGDFHTEMDLELQSSF